MNKILPKITYCVFTYNEEKNIKDCLQSIFDQDYPKDKLEVLVVDDKSTDKTVEIAKNFPVKILISGKRDGDLSATLGFHHATGEFFTALGADARLRGKDWFRKMVKPLVENPDMVFSVSPYYPHPKDSLINKYINLDNQQRDLIYQMFSIDYKDVIVEKKDGYFVMSYSMDKMPPHAHGLYRMSVMKKIIAHQKVYYDLGNVVLLVKNGFTKVGYVPEAGYYHFHADSLKHLLQKRMRNIKMSYLRYRNKDSHYKWFDLTRPKDAFKIMLLVVCANLFLPLFLFSLYRAIKHKNVLYLLEAPITFLVVDTIVFAFLKDKRGWLFLKENVFKILRIKK